jgi:hypothetical protein
MSVFALASRYTNDVRVLLDEPVETPLDEDAKHTQWQTAGFKYYSPILGKLMVLLVVLKAQHHTEVEKKKLAIINPASLFEIQTLCVCACIQASLNDANRLSPSLWRSFKAKLDGIAAHGTRLVSGY